MPTPKSRMITSSINNETLIFALMINPDGEIPGKRKTEIMEKYRNLK
jgi:hypothetical protein